MPAIRLLPRLAVGAVLALAGASLSACAPAAPVSACPEGFVGKVQAAAREQGLGIEFAQASPVDFEPAALQSWVATACVLAFEGDLPQGHAEGHFAFGTGEMDPDAFSLAVQELGFSGGEGTWILVDEDDPTAGQVVTLSKPGDGGSLVDVEAEFPAATSIISSFRVVTS